MMKIENTIVELIKEYDAMDSDARDEVRGQVIVKDIRLIGNTAAFFGGYDGMTKVHDAAEALAGKDNSVGYWLNKMWDGIGGWWA